MKKNAGKFIITGSPGSGKTTCQKELIEGRSRIIILDPMDNFGAKGFKRCRDIPDIAHHVKWGWHDGFKIIVPTGHREDHCQVFMRRLIPALFHIQRPYHDSQRGSAGKEITLVIDEAHKFFPNRKMTPAEQEPLEDLVSLHRHYGVEIIAASQRLAKVWTEYRGTCTEQYFFAQGDHTDIEAALKSLGPSQREALLNLKQHEYLHKSRTAGATVRQGRNVAKFR